jgi:hypothetical protein
MSHKIPQEMTSPDNRTLLVFGDYAWPKCVKTNFKMFNTDKNLLNYYNFQQLKDNQYDVVDAPEACSASTIPLIFALVMFFSSF